MASRSPGEQAGSPNGRTWVHSVSGSIHQLHFDVLWRHFLLTQGLWLLMNMSPLLQIIKYTNPMNYCHLPTCAFKAASLTLGVLRWKDQERASPWERKGHQDPERDSETENREDIPLAFRKLYFWVKAVGIHPVCGLVLGHLEHSSTVIRGVDFDLSAVSLELRPHPPKAPEGT